MKQCSKFLITAGLRGQVAADWILATDKGFKHQVTRSKLGMEKRERKAGENCVQCTLKDQ